jgi:hypothetical protein
VYDLARTGTGFDRLCICIDKNERKVGIEWLFCVG